MNINRLNKVIYLFGLVVILLTFTGCGADVSMKTEIDAEGAGVRTLLITVPEEHYKDINGGIEQLEQTLIENLPGEFPFKKHTAEDNTTFELSIPFSNIKELQEKSELITGEKVQITYTITGTPFSKTYTLSENTKVTDYFNWADQAVLTANLIDTTSNTTPVNSIKNYVILPSNKDETILANNYNWKVSGSERHNIESLLIETTVIDNDFSRKFILSLGNESSEKLLKQHSGEVKKYFNTLSEDINVQFVGNDIVIEIQKDTPNELEALSTKLLGPSHFYYNKVADTSMFRPHYQFIDEFNAIDWLGNGITVEKPIQYKVTFGGTPVNEDGKSYAKDDPRVNSLQEVTFPDGHVRYSARIQEVTPLYYAAIVGLLLIVAAGLVVAIFLYRKNPTLLKSKLSKIFDSNSPASNTVYWLNSGEKCGNCNSTISSDDLFCFSCGINLSVLKCPQCKMPIDSDSNYCFYCGQALKGE